MNRCTDMVQRRAKQDLQDSIKSLREEEKISEMEPTAATLLVVPMPLLDHWRVSSYRHRLVYFVLEFDSYTASLSFFIPQSIK